MYQFVCKFSEENPCYNCKIIMTDEGTLMKTVQKINPGQPEMPEWIYNGAILGVQGGNFCKKVFEKYLATF